MTAERVMPAAIAAHKRRLSFEPEGSPCAWPSAKRLHMDPDSGEAKRRGSSLADGVAAYQPRSPLHIVTTPLVKDAAPPASMDTSYDAGYEGGAVQPAIPRVCSTYETTSWDTPPNSNETIDNDTSSSNGESFRETVWPSYCKSNHSPLSPTFLHVLDPSTIRFSRMCSSPLLSSSCRCHSPCCLYRGRGKGAWPGRSCEKYRQARELDDYIDIGDLDISDDSCLQSPKSDMEGRFPPWSSV